MLLEPILTRYHARSLQEAVELLVELQQPRLPQLVQRIASLPLAQARGYLWAYLRAELRKVLPEVLERFPELGTWAAPRVLQRSTQVLVVQALALREGRRLVFYGGQLLRPEELDWVRLDALLRQR